MYVVDFVTYAYIYSIYIYACSHMHVYYGFSSFSRQLHNLVSLSLSLSNTYLYSFSSIVKSIRVDVKGLNMSATQSQALLLLPLFFPQHRWNIHWRIVSEFAFEMFQDDCALTIYSKWYSIVFHFRNYIEICVDWLMLTNRSFIVVLNIYTNH